PYTDQAVYVSGHVVRPGKFAYREGMKLTDVIHSYRDLMPEPYKRHAEIIRLKAPDFTPVVIAFNLDDALAGKGDGILLQPFDTVRIFARFDFEDQPTIEISGEVRFPGNHLTAGALRLRDAVYLAGGTTRDAELADAQVFRRRENGKLEVLSVNLERALRGEERDNILLEPKDRLLIHKSSMRADPPTVKIAGEIERPGRYPLGEGMTVADLVRVAGGLKRGASTEEADLTRYETKPGAGVAGEHRAVAVARALGGEETADLSLRDGDVLTIRQIAGWKDLGATITVDGEVASPGTYGIQQGERLSSILVRAGGFREDAYPYGAVLERVEVREIEEKNRAQMLAELQQEGGSLKGTEAEGEDKPIKDAAIRQLQSTIEKIENTPPRGRMVIHIAKDMRRWERSSSDVEVRAGDRVYIPKRPGSVIVDGAVYHETAVAFRPGKNAGWYLRQAGGPTTNANHKAIFVIRADGSVASGTGGMFGGGVEATHLFAGDMVVVPEKAFRGTTRWKSVFQASQIAQAAAIAATVGKTF
ncbi:MAG: SLBB domain-containing protein, partial [Mycobacterium sp.]